MHDMAYTNLETHFDIDSHFERLSALCRITKPIKYVAQSQPTKLIKGNPHLYLNIPAGAGVETRSPLPPKRSSYGTSAAQYQMFAYTISG